MQWFWDDISSRVESRMATAADCEQEKLGKKALRLEQTATRAWVERQRWDCIADYLEGDNLLQVPLQVGGGLQCHGLLVGVCGERNLQ